MMVIAAGRQEPRAGKTPHNPIETERCVIERVGGFEIAHLQVHMTERRARWKAGPRLIAAGRHEIPKIQSLRGHEDFLTANAPRRTRPVGIDLDAETIWIPQVDCLADRVIG